MEPSKTMLSEIRVAFLLKMNIKDHGPFVTREIPGGRFILEPILVPGKGSGKPVIGNPHETINALKEIVSFVGQEGQSQITRISVSPEDYSGGVD